MYHYTALVTLLAVLFYFYTSTQVARGRIKYGVKLPAITGNADFERILRVQMNTLEWLPPRSCPTLQRERSRPPR